MTCDHCNQEVLALSLRGHYRKCSVYLSFPKDIQKCFCGHKPTSLEDRRQHRILCKKEVTVTKEPITCSGCKVTKPANYFARNSVKKNGRDSKCYQCRKSSKKAYSQEVINAMNREAYDPVNKKKYYDSHRDSILQNKKEYRIKNLDVIKDRIRTWLDKNVLQTKQWRKEYRAKLTNAVYELLGDQCAICGETNRILLTMDHINNDGKNDRHRNNLGWRRDIINGVRPVTDFRILCHSCNLSAYLKNPIHHIKINPPTGIMKRCYACKEKKDTSEITRDICRPCVRIVKRDMKMRCFSLYGLACQKCGETELEKLTLDHLASNGWKMRKEHKSGTEIYRKILDGRLDKSSFACLCVNCNYYRTRDASTPFIQPAEYDIRDIVVSPIDAAVAQELLDAHHYAGFGRGAKILHGAYVDSKLIGVVKYSSIIRQEVATVDNMLPSEVLELDRFCLDPAYHKKNTASYVMARSIKTIESDTQAKAIYSFADPGKGHSGGIYRASNFQYLGQTANSYYYVDQDGVEINKKVVWDKAKRLGLKELEYAVAQDLVKVKTPSKHKFVYRLRK